MSKILIKKNCSYSLNGWQVVHAKAGEVIEVKESVAKSLIAQEKAVVSKGKTINVEPKETKVEEKVQEKEVKAITDGDQNDTPETEETKVDGDAKESVYAEMSKDDLVKLAAERGVKHHHMAGAEKIIEALEAADAEVE